MSLHRVQYKCLSIEIGALFKHSPDSSSPQRGHLLNKCRRGVRIASGSVKRCHGKRRLDCTIVRGPVLHCDECSLLELIVFLGCQVQQFLAASKKLRYKCANPKPRLPHNSMQEQRIIYRPSPMGTPNSGDIETRDIAQWRSAYCYDQNKHSKHQRSQPTHCWRQEMQDLEAQWLIGQQRLIALLSYQVIGGCGWSIFWNQAFELILRFYLQSGFSVSWKVSSYNRLKGANKIFNNASNNSYA